MAGPGMYVSDGKHWTPAKIKVRLGHTDKNDVTPPKYLLDPETGKVVEQYDPAAVEAIRKEMGLGEKDPVEMKNLRIEVAHYDNENEQASLAKTMGKMVDVMDRMEKHIPTTGAAPATQPQK